MTQDMYDSSVQVMLTGGHVGTFRTNEQHSLWKLEVRTDEEKYFRTPQFRPDKMAAGCSQKSGGSKVNGLCA